MTDRLFNIKPLPKTNADLWSVLPLGHRNGKVVRVTALVFIGDVEACLQRLQWTPALSTWRHFRFSGTNHNEFRRQIQTHSFKKWIGKRCLKNFPRFVQWVDWSVHIGRWHSIPGKILWYPKLSPSDTSSLACPNRLHDRVSDFMDRVSDFMDILTTFYLFTWDY